MEHPIPNTRPYTPLKYQISVAHRSLDVLNNVSYKSAKFLVFGATQSVKI
jgi:hypothetical protein